MSTKTKQQELERIQSDIIGQNICPELAKTATQLVFGDGSVDGDIVFIGEAPGKNEDLQGLPFVGAAGKFLDEMLASIGLERKDVYITNIVKYRPPNNRDPLPEEKQAFLPFLQAQLEVIKPKIVATLGKHSTNCFLPDMQISQIHGQPKRIRVKGKGLRAEQAIATWVILPLFHPAAALYNGAMRQTLLDDFALIPAILNKLKSKK